MKYILLFFLFSFKIILSYTSQSFAFEENKGQINCKNIEDASQLLFWLEIPHLDIFLMKTGLAYQFKKTIDSNHYESARMDLELVGANSNCKIIKEDSIAFYKNYYTNNSYYQIHLYQKITYKNIYKGIDWALTATPSTTSTSPNATT